MLKLCSPLLKLQLDFNEVEDTAVPQYFSFRIKGVTQE